MAQFSQGTRCRACSDCSSARRRECSGTVQRSCWRSLVCWSVQALLLVHTGDLGGVPVVLLVLVVPGVFQKGSLAGAALRRQHSLCWGLARQHAATGQDREDDVVPEPGVAGATARPEHGPDATISHAPLQLNYYVEQPWLGFSLPTSHLAHRPGEILDVLRADTRRRRSSTLDQLRRTWAVLFRTPHLVADGGHHAGQSHHSTGAGSVADGGGSTGDYCPPE